MAETPAPLSALSQFSDQLASVVEHAARSIVTVAARPRQTATGIIWRTDTATIILTADHVIEREDEINVTLPDKRDVKAQLIGRDPGTDLAARVVGLNSSQLTRQNSSALPVATLRRVANALVKHGRVQRGYLGVGTQQAPLPAALAHKVGSTQQAALLIITVEPGSPAEQ